MTLDREALNAAFAAAEEQSPTSRCYAPGIVAAITAYLSTAPSGQAPLEGERLTAEQIADHIGVTPYSDMREFVVQAVKYAREKDALLPASAEPVAKAACPYCGATEGLRVYHEAHGSIPAEYVCEACFAPSDTGPCFDDLPLAPIVRQFVNEHAREVKITVEGPSSISENTLTEMEARHMRDALIDAIPLTQAERQSGVTRVQWAENLIRQLPEDHDGRNSWLLNYGTGPKPPRREYKVVWDAPERAS